MTDSREEFEKHIDDCIVSEVGFKQALEKDVDGEYTTPWVNSKWQAWRAAREALLTELRNDAERWRWLVRHASLGFDGAPSWNAVVRLPVFDSADQTITALVDRARTAVGDA